MRLYELLNNAGLKYDSSALTDFVVTGLNFDSRKIIKGNIFFAIKGYKEDGNKYIKSAIENGASLIISDTLDKSEFAKFYGHSEAGFLKVDSVRKSMAVLSNLYYGRPSEKIKLIGITGTNGKTTISYILKEIIESCGFKCGIIGTVSYEFGSSKKDSSLTTPESIEINMMLNEMIENGYEYCIMEVSSIALVVDRVYGLNFIGAAFTNLSPEHLDLHGNMENYFSAKKTLFDNLNSDAVAVSNSDDDYGLRIISDTKGKKYMYGIDRQSNFNADEIFMTMDGLEFSVYSAFGKYKIISKLTGRFNVYNILAAFAISVNLNFDISRTISAINNFEPVKGRFNKISLPNGAFAVIDYSHTSDSLKNAIESAVEIRNLKKEGRVITIFGCGGNKDRTKRPVMGNFAATLSDITIITSDNPRFEDPYDIINEITSGIDNKYTYEIIENREDAIKRGIEISKKDDIILICGKGHETYQEVKGEKSHFDDKEIVEKYFNSAK